jgi:hypothetical protein
MIIDDTEIEYTRNEDNDVLKEEKHNNDDEDEDEDFISISTYG